MGKNVFKTTYEEDNVMKTKKHGFLKASRYFLLAWVISIGLISIIATGGGGEEDGNEPSDIENRVFNLVNQHRAQLGLAELAWRETIAVQCRTHSENMAEGKTPFGHEGFFERVENIRNEIAFDSASEQVCYNAGYADPADAALAGWLESAEHREEIEGDNDLIGVGVAKTGQDIYYFTQILIRL